MRNVVFYSRPTRIAILCVACFLSFPSLILAQNYESMHVLSKTLSNFSITEACCGQEGYVIAGNLLEPGNSPKDILITGTDPEGVPIWSRKLNRDVHERVTHIEAVSEGYAITGFVRGEFPSMNRLTFAVLDPSGNVVLSKIINDNTFPNWQLQGAHVLEVDNGDGYLITGYFSQQLLITSNPQIAAIRLDPAGNLMWGKLYDTPDDGRADFDMGAFAVQIEDEFYITGSANVRKNSGLTTQGVLSMMIDGSGNLQWANNYAIEPGDDIEIHGDVGTSALFDENQGVVVTAANSTLTTNFYVSLIDPASGAILAQTSFDGGTTIHTPSYYIGQNYDGNYLVSGLIAKSPTRYDCNGLPIDSSTIPFVTEITPDLQIVVASVKYPMHAPGFTTTDDASLYHGHLGTGGLRRPLITTPEMAYTSPTSNRTVLLGYREDGPAGNFDLQFISNQSPDYSWCLVEDFDLRPTRTQSFRDQDVDDTDFDDLNLEDDYPNQEVEVPTLDCESSLPNGSGFPIVARSAGASDEVRGTFANDRNLVVKDGYSYGAGRFAQNMNNPSLSHSDSDLRPWVAKYDPNGNVLWARKATGSTGYNNFVTAIDVDDQNSVYVAGFFSDSTLLFDGDQDSVMTSGETLPNGGTSSYIIKYDAYGNFVWRALLIKDINDFGAGIGIRDIVIGDDGFLYATGFTVKTISFYTDNYVPDPTMGTNFVTTPAHVGHAFVAKYNTSNGEIDFFESQDTSLQNVFPRKIEVSSTANIYIGGDHYAAGIWEPTVLEFNSTGTVTNSVTANTNGQSSFVNSMTLDNNYLYLAGYGESQVSFGGASVALNNDGWFGRISTSLASPTLNSVTDGSSAYTIVSDINVDASGDVYILGAMEDSASFTNGGSLSLIGTKDIFVARYNTNLSSSSWEQNYGGTSTMVNPGTIVEDDINCGSFISADFEAGSVDLGISSGIISAPVGTFDHFIARIDDSGASYKTVPGSDQNTTTTSSDQTSLHQDEALALSEPTIYPVPAEFGIVVDNIGEESEILLLDLQGKVLRKYSRQNGVLEIARDNLPTGIYFLKISSAENTWIKKVQFN